MALSKALLFTALLALFAAGDGAVTAPSGLPQQIPPTSTVYNVSYGWTLQLYPCQGQPLFQPTTTSYPDSAFTTTVTSSTYIPTPYRCGTETIVPTEDNFPPTFTTYLTTTTSTQLRHCGGFDIFSKGLAAFGPFSKNFTTTVTSATTTATEYTCTAYDTSIDTATFSGACRTLKETPVFPSDYADPCPRYLEGLSGCPWSCGTPRFTVPSYYCYDRNIEGDFPYPDPLLSRPRCYRCLPPCESSSLPSSSSSILITSTPSRALFKHRRIR